jgi:hypothetical protein
MQPMIGPRPAYIVVYALGVGVLLVGCGWVVRIVRAAGSEADEKTWRFRRRK